MCCIQAAAYTNEQDIGPVFDEFFTQPMAPHFIARSDVFVTTKLWNTVHRSEHVRPAVMGSLDRLHLEYVDLLLIHWPVSFKLPSNAGDVRRDWPREWTDDHPMLVPVSGWHCMQTCRLVFSLSLSFISLTLSRCMQPRSDGRQGPDLDVVPIRETWRELESSACFCQ